MRRTPTSNGPVVRALQWGTMLLLGATALGLAAVAGLPTEEGWLRLGVLVAAVLMALIDNRLGRVPNRYTQTFMVLGVLVLAGRVALGRLDLFDLGVALLLMLALFGLFLLGPIGGADFKVAFGLLGYFPSVWMLVAIGVSAVFWGLITLALEPGAAGLKRLGAILFTTAGGLIPRPAEIAEQRETRGNPSLWWIVFGAGVYLLWPWLSGLV